MSKQKLETDPSFQEAYTGDKQAPIYLGHADDLMFYRKDIEKNGEKSPYFKNAFCPERNGVWTVEKNKNWMLGGIAASRKFLLISDFHHFEVAVQRRIDQIKGTAKKTISKDDVYSKQSQVNRGITNIGVTYDELRWLYDNGYKFIVYDKNPTYTLALPPQSPNKELVAKNYEGLIGDDCNDDVMQELLKIQNILDDISQQRAQSKNIYVSPKLRPKFNDNSTKVESDDLLNLFASKDEQKNAMDSFGSGFRSNSSWDNRRKNSYQSGFFNSRASADNNMNWRNKADTSINWRKSADTDMDWRSKKDSKFDNFPPDFKSYK